MAEPTRGAKARQVMYVGSVCSSKMDKNHFGIRQPLVRVHTDFCSKFADGKELDKGVLDYLFLQVIKEMQKSGKCYSADNGTGPIYKELGYRPVVCSIFPVFSTLAPRFGELLEGEDPKYSNRAPVGFVHEQAGTEMEVDEEGAIEGETVGSVMSGSELSGWSFSDGKLLHEDGTNLKPHEAVHCKAYVVDHTLPGPQSVVRGLFEMKGVAFWTHAVPQVLNYGSAAAMANVLVGRYKKVHLMVLGIGWAGCAEIDPIGVLDIKPRNSITPAAVTKFRKHAQGKYNLLSKSTKNAAAAAALKAKYLDVSIPDLVKYFQNEVKLKMDIACLALNKNLSSDVYAPLFNKEERILVGSATYDMDPMTMMQYPVNVKKTSAPRDDALVVAGMARIIFGDRVLKWTLPGLLAHAAKREQEADHEAVEIMARTHYA